MRSSRLLSSAAIGCITAWPKRLTGFVRSGSFASASRSENPLAGGGHRWNSSFRVLARDRIRPVDHFLDCPRIGLSACDESLSVAQDSFVQLPAVIEKFVEQLDAGIEVGSQQCEGAAGRGDIGASGVQFAWASSIFDCFTKVLISLSRSA